MMEIEVMFFVVSMYSRGGVILLMEMSLCFC